VLRQAWVYVIAAEIYGSATGIGRVLIETGRGADAERSLAAIFAIGFVAFVFDMILRALRRRMFAWAPK
jgi:ABC-type nitrate/sulfonate/bicarbonate transport system permease component